MLSFGLCFNHFNHNLFSRDGISYLFSYYKYIALLRREGYREREEPVVGYNSGFNPHMKHSVEPLQVFVSVLRQLVILWLMLKVMSALSVHYRALQ